MDWRKSREAAFSASRYIIFIPSVLRKWFRGNLFQFERGDVPQMHFLRLRIFHIQDYYGGVEQLRGMRMEGKVKSLCHAFYHRRLFCISYQSRTVSGQASTGPPSWLWSICQPSGFIEFIQSQSQSVVGSYRLAERQALCIPTGCRQWSTACMTFTTTNHTHQTKFCRIENFVKMKHDRLGSFNLSGCLV